MMEKVKTIEMPSWMREATAIPQGPNRHMRRKLVKLAKKKPKPKPKPY